MTTEDFKTYNNKRAFRRRQLHTWSRRLAEVQAKPLKDMNQDQLEKIQQDLYTLESTMEGLGEEAFQTLSEESGLLAKEQDAQEQFEQELFLVLELVNRLIKLKKMFTRHRKVQLEGKTLISMGPDACLVERRYDDFISTCQDLITEDVALLDHTQMAAEHAATEALMGEVQKCLSTKKVPHDEDDGEDDAPTRRSGPIIMGPGLNLEMPHFDGQPRNWAKFKRMFQIVLDTRGSHYDAVAKSVLLENSMKTKDAKDVVIRNSTGDDPYNKAMTALSEKYGNPRVLLPILVRDLTHNEDVYAYTKEGLQALYDHYVTSYEHLQDIIADSLTTYLCQCAREHFSPKLREEWDRYASPLTALPTIADIRNFVNKLVNQMEPTSTSTSTKSHKPSAPPTSSTGNGSFGKCPFCKGLHPPMKCAAFLAKDVSQRYQTVREHKLCLNCLRLGHNSRQCTSRMRCKTCGKNHHTLIHLIRETTTTTSAPPAATSMKVDPLPTNNETPTLSFIDTIIVDVSNGSLRMKARAALDSGAGISMISESLASSLKLPRHPQHIAYEGIRGKGVSKAYVHARLTSTRDSNKYMDVILSVIPRLGPVQRPRDVADLLNIRALKELELSDPDLGGNIDLLLGNLDRSTCIDGAPVVLTQEKITLTPTIFGWSVAGPLHGCNPVMLQTTAKPDDLYQALSQQWELEAIPAPPNDDATDPAVQHFDDTHTRDASGRYVVRLPRKKTPPTLGKSRRRAMRRYVSNEKSLLDKGTYEQFRDVLTEYITMGHAEYVPRPIHEDNAYYLPVHGVTKADSTTTKLRAVFDASAPTTTGSSLNDLLEAGPNLYPALPDILIRFRSHPIALTADIGKMFREVMLHPSERNYHRFFIRSADGELRDCRMTRLTFGVKSSPFVATQVLRHLASQHTTSHPQASRVIKTDFYVDDCLTGVDSIDEGKRLQRTLCELLQSAGMTLRKWRTNSHALLNDIPPELQETADLTIRTSEEAPKALGIHWDVTHDVLHVSTPVDIKTTATTKRVVASVTAQIFDVLGLMAPAIITAKILLQNLWKLPLKWDDPLPDAEDKLWQAWVTQLPQITTCAIPRRMTMNNLPIVFKSLHGFADASSLAYGAVIYLRTVHEDGNTNVAIVTAKARVLPLKTLTIPRAELVAASLLTKLLTYVARILDVPNAALYAWTDSAIVLHWLHKPPNSLKVFVRNRVSHIQEHLPPSHWRHVDTAENPADLLSRGCPAAELSKNQLWWKGPPWLMQDPGQWKTKQIVKVTLPVPEIRAEVNTMKVTLTPPPSDERWSQFSSFTRAVRIMSWAKRFANNALHPASARTTTPYLTSDELLTMKQQLLRLAQEQSFPEVYEAIKSRKPLPKSHFLFRTTLHVHDALPYFTVSGRIRNTTQPTSTKQLIPLRAKAPLTMLFLKTCHSTHGHPGTEALLATLSEQYYIQGARNLLKKISRECVTCQKTYARPLQPAMGLLPSVRTTPAPPFTFVGLDFAGPFKSRRGHTRKPVHQDCYVCLFVCMTTRAVHLDVCMDLSTDEFLAVLRRFMARRGVPNTLYSDNGTNFVGASSEIKKFLQHKDTKQTMSHLTSTHDVKWKFIPPRAPHMGGLWEAGVRCMKTLLKKIVKPHPLRVDEFYTILTEVEATLNSRPLAPLHVDGHPEDIVLTPGHFLIQRPLKAPPLPQELSKTTTTSHLRRWTLVQHLNQTLWDRWLHTYLQSRFARSKWHIDAHEVKVGDIVLIRDVTLRRRNWPLGKVTQTFPGTDGVTRTVEVLCHGKLYTRAVHLLCPLVNSTAPTDPTTPSPEAVEEPEPSNVPEPPNDAMNEPREEEDKQPEDDEDDVPEKEIQNANILTVNLPDDDDFNLPYDDPGDDDDAPKLTYDEDANGRNPSTKSQATSPSTCKEAPRDSGEVTTPPRESVRDMAVPVPPWAGSQALYRRATYSSPAEDKQSPETTPLDSTPSSVDYVD